MTKPKNELEKELAEMLTDYAKLSVTLDLQQDEVNHRRIREKNATDYLRQLEADHAKLLDSIDSIKKELADAPLSFYDALIECGYGSYCQTFEGLVTMRIRNNRVEMTATKNLADDGDGGWIELGSLCCKLDNVKEWKVRK